MRAALRFVIFAMALLSAAPALAQDITVSRVTGNRQRGTPGTIGVSRQDCIDNIQLTFSLALSNMTSTYDLQVWAGESGANCEDPNNRTGTNISRCRQVAPSQRTTSATFQIKVPARNLAAAVAPPPQPSAYEESQTDACDVQTTPGARTVSVFFMLMNGSTVIKAVPFKSTGTSSATTPSTAPPTEGVIVDLKGPDPPSNVRIATGDRRLRLDWTPTGDRDVKGYAFYCQPAAEAPRDGGNQSTVTRVCPEGGTSEPQDAGADGGDGGDETDGAAVDPTDPDAGCVDVPTTSAAGACPAPTISPATECGRIIQTGATSGNTDRKLTNLTEYAIAVAALDAFDNVGTPAAAATCGSPEAVADFWREYNAAGGNAGGFCALEAAGLPTGSNVLTVSMITFIALAFAARRARRKS